jgi:hypothetical protein
VLSALIFTGLNACKKVTVPETVKSAFARKYSDAKNVKWDQEEDNLWEAEFETSGLEMSATFNGNGAWLETEWNIEAKEVPEAVKNTLKKKFSDYKIKEYEYIESPHLRGYEVLIENPDDEKLKVVFDKEGKGLQREKVTDED